MSSAEYRKQGPVEVGPSEIEKITRSNIEAFIRLPSIHGRILFRVGETGVGELTDPSRSPSSPSLIAAGEELEASVLKVLQEELGLNPDFSQASKRTIITESDQMTLSLPKDSVIEYRKYPLSRDHMKGNIIKRVTVTKGNGVIKSDEWAIQKAPVFGPTTSFTIPKGHTPTFAKRRTA